MLDFMRENQERMKFVGGLIKALLAGASMQLKILDPVRGEKELIRLVAVEAARLSRG